ncbi:MAG: hypothetical protein LBJ59_06380 [Zoogloeaceae bacterium]|jgi:hypothetical protein|nr:hypothetical protein [Zoogloeaceae bacterium]
MISIAASIPGRMRLRVASGSPDLAKRLSALDVSCRAEARPQSGSLLLFYDPARLPQKTLEAVVERLLTPAASEVTRPTRQRHYTRTSLRINRYAKYGMLAGLGASLVYAATGSTRAHVWTGAVFVACLGVHLAVHRHRLTT